MAEEVNVNHFHRIFEELKNLGRLETQTLYDVINKRIINNNSYRDAMFELNKEYPNEVVSFKDAVCVNWNMAEKVNPGIVNKIIKELQIRRIGENEKIKQIDIMKIRICKVAQFSSCDKKIKTYYQIERKYLFFWTKLLYPCITSLDEAEKWAENYIYMNGKGEQESVIKEYNVP